MPEHFPSHDPLEAARIMATDEYQAQQAQEARMKEWFDGTKENAQDNQLYLESRPYKKDDGKIYVDEGEGFTKGEFAHYNDEANKIQAASGNKAPRQYDELNVSELYREAKKFEKPLVKATQELETALETKDKVAIKRAGTKHNFISSQVDHLNAVRNWKIKNHAEEMGQYVPFDEIKFAPEALRVRQVGDISNTSRSTHDQEPPHEVDGSVEADNSSVSSSESSINDNELGPDEEWVYVGGHTIPGTDEWIPGERVKRKKVGVEPPKENTTPETTDLNVEDLPFSTTDVEALRLEDSDIPEYHPPHQPLPRTKEHKGPLQRGDIEVYETTSKNGKPQIRKVEVYDKQGAAVEWNRLPETKNVRDRRATIKTDKGLYLLVGDRLYDVDASEKANKHIYKLVNMNDLKIGDTLAEGKLQSVAIAHKPEVSAHDVKNYLGYQKGGDPFVEFDGWLAGLGGSSKLQGDRSARPITSKVLDTFRKDPQGDMNYLVPKAEKYKDIASNEHQKPERESRGQKAMKSASKKLFELRRKAGDRIADMNIGDRVKEQREIAGRVAGAFAIELAEGHDWSTAYAKERAKSAMQTTREKWAEAKRQAKTAAEIAKANKENASYVLGTISMMGFAEATRFFGEMDARDRQKRRR
jgi:hypothetical protein